MNTNMPERDTIQEHVLKQVREGKVRRTPRAYFWWRAAGILIVSIIVLVIAAFLVSFILFSLQESGEVSLLSFGPHGVATFFALFPWLLAVVAIMCAALAEWFLRVFKFGYRLPLVPVFITVFLGSILLGGLIALTPLHRGLLDAADHDDLPIVGALYEHIFDAHDDRGFCRGVVVGTSTEGLLMRHDDRDHDRDDETYTVALASDTPPTAVPPQGARVAVFGDPHDGCAHAQFMQTLSPR